MFEPLISVLVPVYNMESFLEECLDSIVNQTYKNLEIIIIDDGSTDTSGEICDRYALQDKRIKVYHEVNHGLAITRNIALSYATGDYVYSVDSDDYIDLETCEHIVAAFQASRADVVIFGYYLVYNAEHLKEVRSLYTGEINCEDALIGIMSGDIGNYFWNKAYTREVLSNISFPPGRVWEDIGTMYKVFLNAKKIYCMEGSFYYYRQRANSIVHTVNDKAICDIFFLRKERYDALMKDYPHAAQKGIEDLAMAAIRLYDRSLWRSMPAEDLQNAKEFLKDKKAEVLNLKKSNRYMLYYYNISVYNVCRIAIHKIGNIVKRFKRYFA